MAARALLLLALAALLAAARGVEICDQVKTCRRNGNTECDRSKEDCPPCIFALENGYTCWDKVNTTNTCPFTGVKYDCSTAWAAQKLSTTSNATANSLKPSSNSTSTSGVKTSASEGTPGVLYAAIGGGVVLIVIIVLVVVSRRKKRASNMPKFGESPPAVYSNKNGAKAATANTPYMNAPSTSKGPASYHRKFSDPVLESSSVKATPQKHRSDYSGNTTKDSLDAMLMDNTPPTAVLGDPPSPRKRGLSKGFKRINSGGSHKSNKRTSSNYDVQARCTNNANVLDEYLKMKQEMNFDADVMSDYGSDTMSLDRFSVASTSTIGGHNARAMSMTDSEYQSDLLRSRTESECFSEMSYNDEKYSFSEEEPVTTIMLDSSIVRKLTKEVEI